MQAHHIILILFVIDALINIAASFDEKKYAKVIYLSKPLLMPLLILYLLTGAAAVNWWIVCALAFGFWGDVFLMLPGEKQKNFLLGLVAFLVNQVLYVVAFLTSAGDLAAVPLWIWALGIPCLIYGLVYYRLLAPGLGRLKGPVVVYMAVILAMGVSSLVRWPAVPASSFWPTLAGAFLFIASDSVLAWDKFRKQFSLSRVITMATYIAAQFLIASGFMN